MMIPAPLHAVHSYGFRRVSPSAPSSARPLALGSPAGVLRRPVASQNTHASPPVPEHPAHGSGSRPELATSAAAPSANTAPATETNCVVSYGSLGIARATPRRARDVAGASARARASLVAARDDDAVARMSPSDVTAPRAMMFPTTRPRATPRATLATARWTRVDVVTPARARAVVAARHARERTRVMVASRASSDDDDDDDDARRATTVKASRATVEALRARARGDGGFGADALLDGARERWDVPWGGGTVAVGLAGWGVAFVGVAAVVLPLVVNSLGIDPRKLSAVESAEYLLVVQCAETAVSLGLVYALVSPYAETIREEGKDWFKIDFSEPFERERGWAKYGLIGYAMTFLALGATGFALDAVERAGGGQQAVDAAAKQAGTIDGVLPLIQDENAGTMIAVLTVTSVLAPLLEEVVFRGFLLASLTKWLPTPGAVLFSSVLFALAHLAPRDFVELTVLGMVLGFSYARTRNLLTPMLIHSLWNSGVLVVLAIAIKLDVAHELGVPGY